MQANPLRAEFVLAGLGLLFAVYALLEALGVSATDWLLQPRVREAGLAGFGLLLALAYVLGIVVVQLTYFFPTTLMITVVRNSRFRDLKLLEENAAVPLPPTADGAESLTEILATAFRSEPTWTAYQVPWVFRGVARRLKAGTEGWHFSRRIFRQWAIEPPVRLAAATEEELDALRRRHAQTLALTVGRALAPQEVTDEYKYRRANRQVFVGILPSVVVAGVAATVALGRSSIVWIPVVPVATVGLVWAVWQSAAYQERIAQSLIIDIAYLRRCRATPSAIAGDVAEPQP